MPTMDEWRNRASEILEGSLQGEAHPTEHARYLSRTWLKLAELILGETQREEARAFVRQVMAHPNGLPWTAEGVLIGEVCRWARDAGHVSSEELTGFATEISAYLDEVDRRGRDERD